MPAKNNIFKFEEKIKQLVEDRIIKHPLDDEFLEHLLEKEESVEFSKEFRNKILHSIKKGMERRKIIKGKLNNPELVNSFGEYLSYFREIRDMPINKISEMIDVEPKILVAIEDDNVNPMKIQTSLIANIIEFLKISLGDAYSLLEKSLMLFDMKKRGIITESHPRIDKNIKETEKEKLHFEALKDLLLKVEVDKYASKSVQLSFSFREDLQKELIKRDYNA